jgi:hypothetical protein
VAYPHYLVNNFTTAIYVGTAQSQGNNGIKAIWYCATTFIT